MSAAIKPDFAVGVRVLPGLALSRPRRKDLFGFADPAALANAERTTDFVLFQPVSAVLRADQRRTRIAGARRTAAPLIDRVIVRAMFVAVERRTRSISVRRTRTEFFARQSIEFQCTVRRRTGQTRTQALRTAVIIFDETVFATQRAVLKFGTRTRRRTSDGIDFGGGEIVVVLVDLTDGTTNVGDLTRIFTRWCNATFSHATRFAVFTPTFHTSVRFHPRRIHVLHMKTIAQTTSAFRTTFVFRFVHVTAVRVSWTLDHLTIDETILTRTARTRVDGPRLIGLVDLLVVITLFRV